MLNAGLIEELTATTVAGPAYVCHIGQDGEALALRATALALASVAEGAGAAIASLLIGTAGKAAVEVGVPAGVDPDGPPAALMSASEDNRGPDGPGRPGETGRCQPARRHCGSVLSGC
jgi:hypothetical protein